MTIPKEGLGIHMSWGQFGDEGDCMCPLTALYEYGRLSVLFKKAGLEPVNINFGMANFTSKDNIWGLSLKWPKALQKNHKFVFIIQFDILPDLILADDKIIWCRTQNDAPLGRVVMTYVPDADGETTLSFIKDEKYREPGVSSKNIRFGHYTGCYNQGPCEPCQYVRYDAIEKLKVKKVEPLLTEKNFFTDKLLEPDLEPIKPQNYETMDVDIIHETIDAYLPYFPHRLNELTTEQEKHMIDTIPILEANGIDGMMLYHMSKAMLDALAQSKLRRFIVQTCSAGEWWGPFPGNESHETRIAYESGLKICNRLLERISDCKVYIWFPEIDGRQYSLFQKPEIEKQLRHLSLRADLIKHDDTTDNTYWREELFADENRKWKEYLVAKTSDPSRVIAIYQCGRALAITELAQAGCDMTVNKAIFRDCFNIVTSVGRGTQKALNLPHGYDYDPWSWMFRMNHHPDEWTQGLLVYLHAGGSFLFHEGTFFRRDIDNKMKMTESGARFCQAGRYAKKHPSTGKQIAKIAAMRGHEGVPPRDLTPCFSAMLRHDENGPAWLKDMLGDYHLLETFFPKFGGFMGGNFQRLSTGTPYGPLDIIPWNTPEKVLNEYDLIFVMGRNGCTKNQFENFCNYVKQGGKLLLALGQLKTAEIEPRGFIDADIAKLTGLKISAEGSIAENINAEIITRFADNSFLAKHKLGKGELYIITTKCLTTMGYETPQKLLAELAEPSRFIVAEPLSDWLEVMANRKKSTVSLCLFNHGQIGFPSGNGPKSGIWQGMLTVDLNKLELGKNTIIKIVNNGCELKDIPFEIRENKLSFEGKIDKFSEWVIGPSDSLESDWYGPAE